MKKVSCSICYKLCYFKKTVIIEHKRVCHECRANDSKKEFSL